MKRIFAALAFVLVAVAPAWAADQGIAYFAGSFSGTGLITDGDGSNTTASNRMSTVQIEVTDVGFTIFWNTLSLDQEQPNDVKVKASELRFARTDKPTVFRLAEEPDLLSGKPIAWAWIKGNTLWLSQLVVGEDGTYDVQTWARTVEGDKLSMIFSRFEDGELARSVRGELLRDGN